MEFTQPDISVNQNSNQHQLIPANNETEMSKYHLVHIQHFLDLIVVLCYNVCSYSIKLQSCEDLL